MNTGALQEFKSHEHYERFMKAINEGVQQYRDLFPNDIEFDFLLKGKPGSA